MTTSIEEIVNAIVTSDLVEASADQTKIRRKLPLPVVDNSKECTLYVKGFPLDDTDVTIETISEQFSVYGRVCMVRLRKDIHKKFKGSCFIEFDQPSSLEAALAAANQGGVVTLSFKGTPYLCVMKLSEWLERKAAKSGKSSGEKKPAGEKRKRDDEPEAEEETNEDAPETKEKSSVVSFTPGLIISITGIPATATLFQIKDAIKPHGEVKYVEYTAGETTGHVRLGDPSSAGSVLAALTDGEIKITGEGEGATESTLAGTVVTGEEEVAYWTKIGQGSKPTGGRGGKGRGGGRGRGRGGRGGGKRSRR